MDPVSLSTTLVDWALVIPNVALELDLGNPNRLNTPTLVLQVKGAPSSRDYLGETVFRQYSYRFWDGRVDFRYHFTFRRHAEYIKSRFYAGLFGEYMDYTLRTPIDIIDRDALKDGRATIFGLTGGYEFPGYSYHNKHFFQFQLGGSFGFIHANYDSYTDQGSEAKNSTVPMMTELRFALAYRKKSISRKYWQPNYDRYRRVKAEDDRMLEHLDQLLEDMEADPVTIYMKHAPGLDTTFLSPLTLQQVRHAFRLRFKSPYLRTEKLEPLYTNTSFPITKPSEFYLVSYKVPVRAHDYDAEETEREFYFPFRVRFEGYDEAIARQTSFNQAMRKYYYDHGRQLPTMMVQAVDRDNFVASPSIRNVLELLNEKWPESNLRPEEVTGLYYRTDGEFQPIKEGEMLHRGTYALGLKFHQQVGEAYDTLSTRFNLVPYVDDNVQFMYESLLRASTTTEFYVHHPWLNGRESEVTRDDVIRALAENGYAGYTADNIAVEDTIRYGRNVGTASFGNVLNDLRFVYVVEDSVSLRAGNQFHKALQKALSPRRATWNTNVVDNLSMYGPLVQGRWDDKHQLVPADNTEVIDAVMKHLIRVNPALAAESIHPYQIENFTYSGIHEIPDGKPLNRWTVLRFAYRFVNSDGHSRVAYAHVAYRLKIPTRGQ